MATKQTMRGANAFRFMAFLAMAVSSVMSCRTPDAPSRDLGRTAPRNDAPATLHPVIRIRTTLGSFDIKLDAEKAPLTVVNFFDYVRDGFYVGTIFHRVVSDSLIQAGKYTKDMTEKRNGLHPSIPSEWGYGLRNVDGTVGMVRRPGLKDSAVAEFYINVVENVALDIPRDGAGYTVFGEVVDGLDTIERIRVTPVAAHPKYADGRSAVVPVEPVVIESTTILVRLDESAARRIAEAHRKSPHERIAELVTRLETEGAAKAVRTETGLVYVDLRFGDGAEPLPEGRVDVYYRGTLLDGTEFEASMDKPKQLMVGNLIKGWREGILTMKEGGKRVLIIPPELGFGVDGVPGLIPPNATLVFEVELIEVR